MILDNTNFNENIYIFHNIDSSWLSPVSIESMGESFAIVKGDSIVFNGKTCMGLQEGEHLSFH